MCVCVWYRLVRAVANSFSFYIPFCMLVHTHTHTFFLLHTLHTLSFHSTPPPVSPFLCLPLCLLFSLSPCVSFSLPPPVSFSLLPPSSSFPSFSLAQRIFLPILPPSLFLIGFPATLYVCVCEGCLIRSFYALSLLLRGTLLLGAW